MKNLAHLPLEKLELTRPRLSMRWSIPSAQNDIDNKNRIYPERHHSAWHLLWKKMGRVIETSVGMNWDEVYSKLSQMMIGVKFDFDFDYRVQSLVTRPVWSYRNQRWEVRPNGYRWGHLIDLLDYIQSIKVKSYLCYPDEFYYICPKSNILRLVRSKELRKERDSEFWRRHYKFLTHRKRRKYHKEIHYHTLLRMINDPQLFKFYTGAVKEYRALIKKVEDYRETPRPKDLWERIQWKRSSVKQEDFIRIESLKNQIEELEAGNYNTFFESAVYLYSRAKECHHVAAP